MKSLVIESLFLLLALIQSESPFNLCLFSTFDSWLDYDSWGKSASCDRAKYNGKSYKLEYCSKQQLKDAVQAIERLAQIG